MADGYGPAALAVLVNAFPWIELHTAPPGPDGTAAVAAETTQQKAVWVEAGPNRAVNAQPLVWRNIAGSETIAYFAAKDAAGRFGFPGTVAADRHIDGDTFTIPAGELAVMVPLAS